MLQVLQTYEWFKEVLKCMSTFEVMQTDDIMYYEHNGVLLEVNRMHDNRTMLIATAVGHDVNYEIFKYIVFSNISTVHPNIYWYREDDCRFTYSLLHNDTIRLKSYNLDEDEVSGTGVVLDYPLKEEQVFQQLTRFNLPEEEYINRFVKTSEEIISVYPALSTISYRSGYISNQINETNHKNMVQSVMDCMIRLQVMEQMRIQKCNKSEA